jgi:hypothetical protein
VRERDHKLCLSVYLTLLDTTAQHTDCRDENAVNFVAMCINSSPRQLFPFTFNSRENLISYAAHTGEAGSPYPIMYVEASLEAGVLLETEQNISYIYIYMPCSTNGGEEEHL